MSLSGHQAFEHLQPWFPLFKEIGAAALRDHLAAVPILGLARKTERANDLHRAWRSNFRRLCDIAAPLLEIVEEPDGRGLDYVVSRLASPVALRWGVYKEGSIRRNATARTQACQEQGLLFPSMNQDEHVGDIPVFSIGYVIMDDYTEVGIPQYWFGGLYLLRERLGESEVISLIAQYDQPIHCEQAHATPGAIVSARDTELEQWNVIVEQIRNAA